jgi:hypothetical protein
LTKDHKSCNEEEAKMLKKMFEATNVAIEEVTTLAAI